MLRLNRIITLSSSKIIKFESKLISKSFSNNEKESEKSLIKRLYKKKVDDHFFSDNLNSLIKSKPAFIAFKGDIKMDYFAMELDKFKISATVVNLDLNPVFNQSFKTFYPFVQKGGYAIFLNGKLADSEEFFTHIENGTVELYLKKFNLV